MDTSPPKYYTFADAAQILCIRPSALMRALAQLPELKRRYGTWTIEDLAQINSVVMTMVPQLARKGEL